MSTPPAVTDALAGHAPAVTPAPATRRRAAHATAWTVGGHLATQVLRVAGNVALAALLAPDAFGLMALVTVFLQGLQLFSDTGIRPAIIQHARGDDPVFLNTAWTVQAIRGLVLTVVCAIAAWPVAIFYERPELAWLLAAAGLSNAFGGFNSTALITLNRHLALGRLTVGNIGLRLLQVGVTVLWALVSPTAWALVGGTVVGAACRTVVSHTFLAGGQLRNRFHWDREAASMLFRFGRWVFVGTIIGYLGAQIDRLLLGKLVSLEMLGVYSIAAMLALQPQLICEQITSRVLFPVLSRAARDEPRRLHEGLLRARRVILPAAVVATATVVLVSPAFFGLLYAQRFQGAIWMAQLLAVPAWFLVLSASSSKALYAVADVRPATIAGLVKLVVSGALCLAGLAWIGPAGFILGFGAGALAANLVVVAALARRGLHVAGQDLLHTLALAAVAGSGLAAQSLIPGGQTPLGSLGIAIPILGASALWAWHRARPALFPDA